MEAGQKSDVSTGHERGLPGEARREVIGSEIRRRDGQHVVVENGVPGHNFKFIQVVVSFRRRRHKREEEKRHLFHHQGTSADAQDRVEETPHGSNCASFRNLESCRCDP